MEAISCFFFYGKRALSSMENCMCVRIQYKKPLVNGSATDTNADTFNL